MIITLKLKLPKGVRKKDAYENIANSVNKNIMRKQLNGEIGEEFPITKELIQDWIFDECKRRHYLNDGDLTRRDFWGFMEQFYKTIMGKYIRKDELTTDTDDKYNNNPYYYPGLVYLVGKGYIITNSNRLIKAYKQQREDSLEGQNLHLNQKCKDATDFLKLLKSGDTPKIDGYE